MIPTNSSNWWKRIRKGDILETNILDRHKHVVIVYSDPTSEDDITFKIIHAYGVTPIRLPNDTLMFSRKVIITPFSRWGRSINVLEKGRIRLWK